MVGNGVLSGAMVVVAVDRAVVVVEVVVAFCVVRFGGSMPSPRIP